MTTGHSENGTELTKKSRLSQTIQINDSRTKTAEKEQSYQPFLDEDKMRTRSRELVNDGIKTISDVKIKALETAKETTIQYQHGPEAQKLSNSKRKRKSKLKDQKSIDMKRYKPIVDKSSIMAKKIGSDNVDSPVYKRQKSKDEYYKWRDASQKYTLTVFHKEQDSEYKKDLEKIENLGSEFSTKEESEKIDTKLKETEKNELDEKKELEKAKESKDSAFRDENLFYLTSENPLIEIDAQVAIGDELAIKELVGKKEGLRVDAFGVKRRQNMHKFKEGGRLTWKEISLDEGSKMAALEQDPHANVGRLLSPKEREMADQINDDLTNLLKNIQVDQILSGEKYELPESLMVGIKAGMLYRGISESVVFNEKRQLEETRKKIDAINEQIKRYKQMIEELDKKAKSIPEDQQEKIKSIENLKNEFAAKISGYEENLGKLEEKRQFHISQMKKRETLTLRMKAIEPQANSYIREMRRRSALALAIQIIMDSERGDYRDSCLDVLLEWQRDNIRQLEQIAGSGFQTYRQSTHSTVEESKEYQEILYHLSATYDEIRALGADLPQKPLDREETNTERTEREAKTEKALDKVDLMMSQAREMAENIRL